MRTIIKYILALLLIINAAAAQAQSGGCSGTTVGETVTDMANFGPAAFGSAGDITVVPGSVTVKNTTDANTADMYLGNGSVTDVYAAMNISANAMVWVAAGAVLNIYGDFTNNGNLVVAPGGIVNFYGTTWKNSSTAFVGDGNNANSIPGGAVNFIAARPAVPASFIAAGGCSMYSGGNFAQNIDGGNVPMDIALHVQNANNINLINSNTKIEGTVVFDVADGDVNLGNNNFVFTANGNWSSNVAPNAAYFLTNGTTACAGAVEKLGLPPGQTFTFPIGRAETYSGGRDYTPAMIRNDGTLTDNFQVRVKNYPDAVSVGGVIIPAPQEGMDRAWQITSTNGSGVTMSLQHNSATNGTSYQNVFGSDPTAFITQYQGGGVWNTGPTPTMMTGTVSGSVVHTRGFSVTTTATSCSDPKSWFTKSNDILSPLPVTLESFSGAAQQCSALLRWVSSAEINVVSYEVEYSNNGTTFTKAGTVRAKNAGTGASYTFTYAQGSGVVYYRLKMIDLDGSFKYSSIIKINVHCEKTVILYPNPTTDAVHITGLSGGETIQVYNAAGQLILTAKASGINETINIGRYASGVYEVIIIRDAERVSATKIIKK